MAKTKSSNRKRLHPDDVLAGRGRPPSARELIELIHQVNPSGLDLPAPEAFRRYALKSRLQSLLIRRFESEIEIEVDPERAEGVVSLRHRPLGADACHAVLRELDEDARSWAQRQVDLKAFGGDPAEDETGGPLALTPQSPSSSASEPVAPAALSLPELLRAGQAAIDAYDYDLARDCLSRAFEQARGSAKAALPLLSLLVDHLAADQEALLLEARLAPAALRLPAVRRLLALAAARRSERDRAVSLLQHEREPAAADVYVALATAALDAGHLDHAARDLAQAQALCPAHPSLAGLVATVAERRASERRPLEDDLARLVAERRLEEAETRAHALLVRFPDSAPAKRALREVEEHRTAERARSFESSAEQALARGDAARARSLLHKAIAAGVRGEEAARVQKRLAEIEAAEQAHAERAQQDRVVGLLGGADLTPGLLAYIALDAPSRRRVRKKANLIHLEWLDELGVQGSGARARAAAAAVLALHRADSIVEAEPALALELLGAHEKLLQGLEASEEVAAVARIRLETLAREQAARRLDAARDAFDSGAIDRARELLAGVPVGDLPERDRDSAGKLHAQIEDVLAVRRVKQLCRDGALVRARRDAEALLPRLQGQERALLEATRQELDRAVRQAFRIHLDDTPRAFSPDRDADPGSAPGVLHPETGELILVQSRSSWVFLRIVDLASRTIRLRLTLRTPAPLVLLKIEIDGARLVLIGQFSSVLELSLADWTVLGWHERLGFETNTGLSGDSATRSKADLPSGRNLGFYSELTVCTALVPGTRYLWLAGSINPKWFVRVADLARGRIVRDFEAPGSAFSVHALLCLDRPYILVVRHGEGSVTLHEPHGLPVEGSRVSCAAFREGIVAYPAERKALLFTGDPGLGTPHPETPAPIRWCTLTTAGGISAERVLLHDQAVAEDLDAAVDPEISMVFVRFATSDGGSELAGLRAQGGSEAALEQIFRITIPQSAWMIQGGPGQGVLMLARAHDGIDVFRLGAKPPVFRPGPSNGEIQVEELSFLGSRDCFHLPGTHRATVVALARTMNEEPRAACLARLAQAKRENNAERLMELCYALELNGERAEATKLAAWTVKHHPDHPDARLAQAHAHGKAELWSELRDRLAPVDPSGLDSASAQHFCHLLGVALLHLGETGEALRVLKEGASYPDGQCELSTMLALCTPLPESPDDPDDPGGWNPDQALVRLLMRAIRAADRCIEQGDAAGARRVMERWEVLAAAEVQSLARLAEAYLLGEEVAEDERFYKALALAVFSAVHAERMVLVRRELPIPHARWTLAKLDEVSARATQWLDAHLGEAWPLPPGGL